MKPLNKKFSGFANINIADDEELLNLAQEAGCKSLSIGFDSVSQESMNEVGKKINKVEKYREVVEKIHEYDISVIGCFIFGFDTDKIDIFGSTSEAISKLDLDCIRVNIMTPLPGTPLFHKMKQNNRILTYDWSQYDYQHVVFQPKHMSPEELLDGARQVVKDYFSISKVTRKILQSFNKGFYYGMPITSYLISSYIYHTNLIGLNPTLHRLGINEIQV